MRKRRAVERSISLRSSESGGAAGEKCWQKQPGQRFLFATLFIATVLTDSPRMVNPVSQAQ